MLPSSTPRRSCFGFELTYLLRLPFFLVRLVYQPYSDRCNATQFQCRRPLQSCVGIVVGAKNKGNKSWERRKHVNASYRDRTSSATLRSYHDLRYVYSSDEIINDMQRRNKVDLLPQLRQLVLTVANIQLLHDNNICNGHSLFPFAFVRVRPFSKLVYHARYHGNFRALEMLP